MSSTAAKSKSGKPSEKTVSGRLFILNLSGGQVLTANPDGSDLKVIVNEGRRLPDGIVVDASEGHIYWTNMGKPSANDGSIERADLNGETSRTLSHRGARILPSSSNSIRRTASFTGRIAKACGSCVAIWTAPN